MRRRVGDAIVVDEPAVGTKDDDDDDDARIFDAPQMSLRANKSTE